MQSNKPGTVVYDVAGIGLGPFNLGLAALSYNLPKLNSVFLEEKESFDWHTGMLLEQATLQVPFYADLVTLADPCSPFSYLNFLKTKNRLFKFAIRDNNYVVRIEYNEYCKWVSSQLQNIEFSNCVTAIDFDDARGYFIITSAKERYTARKIVLGTGTKPLMPPGLNNNHYKNVFHSADYLFQKEALMKHNSVVLIGSGQSAAEIFYDLLQSWHTSEKRIAWYTRSDKIFQMDTSPFCCELSTPDYTRYFFELHIEKKKSLLQQQACLYKGINNSLLRQIYDLLYLKMIRKEDQTIHICTNVSMKGIEQNTNGLYKVDLVSEQTQTAFKDDADCVILATGYGYTLPPFIKPITEMISFDAQGNYKVAGNYSIDKEGNRIFVQNAELHTHGFNAPDLSLGPYRNGVILNAILGYEQFKYGERNVFQVF